MSTTRLTLAQAMVRFLCAQKTIVDGETVCLFAGVWAIFGHGNVPALGEALHQVKDELPTYRGQNEQGMVHAASGYAKQMRRKRMMICSSSVGPGASNMLTGVATAYVNRLPVLLLPGDTFMHRASAPVLQEVERSDDATENVNDCFKPISAYFDRFSKPEQLITSLPRAIGVLTDPELCGPVTLCVPQDVQAEAFDFPDSFFDEVVHTLRRSGADLDQLASVAQMISKAKKPVAIAGGGVHYSDAVDAFKRFVEEHNVPVAETSAGKGALPYSHPLNAGGIGVVGSSAANEMVAACDLIIAVGTRLSDFTTGSRTMVSNTRVPQININVAHLDAYKHSAVGLRSDARRALQELQPLLQGWQSSDAHIKHLANAKAQWQGMIDEAIKPPGYQLPSDAQVTEVINQAADLNKDVLVVAAGSMPAEGMKLWKGEHSKGYHSEYGFSCMGYEIAGGIGAKMADPDAEVFVAVGDGTYLMMNSEIVSSVALKKKLIIIVLDNRGFGCINRLQNACGADPFNNLYDDGVLVEDTIPQIDFAAHAAALGAASESVSSLEDLAAALERAKQSDRTYCVAISTNAVDSTGGGSWWQVGIPEVSTKESVVKARAEWQEKGRGGQAY
ncbi:MAG: 3D-(3,5/4)-trihydroxycyclohexane-1,2-dione acylhydrolase (decyclizing) [Granulosicoccaceae bacterium]